MGRFRELVDSEEKMRNFRTKYNIPPHVSVRYVAQGKWYDERKTNEVVIPMIAFIEGGMTIPMGTLTKNYLRYFRMYRSPERKNEPKPDPPQYKLDLQPSTPKKPGILFKIQAC